MTKNRRQKKHSLMGRVRARAQRSKLRTALALAGALAPLALPLGHARADGDGTPGMIGTNGDYATVADPLQNQTMLLRNEDLLLSFGKDDTSNSNFMDTWLSVISHDDNGRPEQTFGQSNDATECQFLQLSEPCNWWFHTFKNEGPPIAGRFFNAETDTVVQYSNEGVLNGRPGLHMVTLVAGEDGRGNATAHYTTRQALPYTAAQDINARPVVADWDGDGFDEIAMVYSNSSSNYDGNARLRFATPVDRNDPSKLWSFGAEFGDQEIGISYQVHAALAADVNGDGRPELVLLYVNNDTLALTLSVYSVSDDLQPTFRSSVVVDTLAQTYATEAMDMVAGNFGVTGQQIVVASRNGSNNYNATVHTYSFGSDYSPMLGGTLDTGVPVNMLKLAAGKFDFRDTTDSVALKLTNVASKSSSAILLLNVDQGTFKPTLAATIDPITDLFGKDKSSVVLDIAVGNFNNQFLGVDGKAVRRNPNLKLALVTGVTDGYGYQDAPQYKLGSLAYYELVRGENGLVQATLSDVYKDLIEGTGFKAMVVRGANLGLADLHGRSLRLANARKIEVDRQTATMVLGAPPMHADYAKITRDAAPTYVNLSWAPERFSATYTTSSTAENSVETTQSKGWTFAAKESLSGEFSSTDGVGILDAKVQVNDTISAEQDINKNTDHKYGTVSSSESDLKVTTLGQDEVWFDEGTSYVYIYDVVGKTICPSGGDSCDVSQRVPLTVMMSAPGDVTSTHSTGDTLEWYQPTWENGNLLSYPANQSQLTASVDQAKILTKTNSFSTNNDNSTWSTKWSVTSNDETDVTTERTFKMENDLSTQVGFTALGTDMKFTADVDLGGSKAFGSLTSTGTTSKQAQGVSFGKNLTFRPPGSYSYLFTPVIFGESQPAGYFDVPSSDSGASLFGAMRTGYYVDVLNPPVQGFIAQNYADLPDLALNHPERRGYVKEGSDGAKSDNCLDNGGEDYDGCASVNPRIPDDPWNDSFHHMRGLFVYRINPVTGETGATQAMISAGDKLRIAARVYNYSTAQMPAGSKANVDFFVMPWDTKDHVPVYTGAASNWIGSAHLPAIQPFSDTANTQNFSVASVDFDPAPYHGQYLTFWVMVSGTNADGTMMQEQDQKGLNALPAAEGTSVYNYLDALALEPTMNNDWKTYKSDPDLTSFSNNIGFYKQIYFVTPLPAATKGVGASPSIIAPKTARAELAGLDVPQLAAKEVKLELGASTLVSGMIHNNTDAVEMVSAYFWDGDPAKGGRLFDVDRYPHIEAGASHKVSTRFTPKTCGDHEVYLQLVHKGVRTAAAKPVEKISVSCAAPAKHEKPHDDGGCSVGAGHSGNSGWGWMLGLFGLGLSSSLRRRRAARK